MIANLPSRTRQEWTVSLTLMATVAAAAWAAAWAMDNASYGVVVGSLIGAVLAGVTVLACGALARRETDPRTARLLIIAPLVKLAMTIVRYAVVFVLYDGSADAAIYHDEGVRLRTYYAEGILNADVGQELIGTGFIRALTGLVYTVTGPTLLGAFFVFSWLGFWGLYLFYRAFCLAVPEGDRHRYAVLVLLLPSLLFWPSSLGKEAWMTLGLGLVAYGSARVLTGRRHGFVPLLLGLSATGVVRPHVAAIAAVALLVAYLTRRAPRGASITAPIGKLVGLIVIGGVLALAIGQTQSLLGIDDFDAEAVQGARAAVIERTNEGESTFVNEETNLDPTEFHIAVMSVLFRPYPWEAENAQAVIAALEGITLLALFVVGWRRVLYGIRSLVRNPYVVMCVTYSVLFIYGFSSFTNFGILTRQRVQVLPFILILVCLPAYHGVREGGWRALLAEPGPDAEAQVRQV
jgi:hypothetical protein